MLILPVNKLEDEIKFPQDPTYFEEKLIKVCNASRRVLLKEWLPMCADILLQYKQTWRQFIPKKKGETLTNMQRFFGTINALLSKQLRLLVMHSLQHFLQFLQKFKFGNDFGDEYKDLALIQLPIIKIKVKPIINTDFLDLEPSLESIKNLIQDVFLKILDVNQNVPHFESVVFPELANDGKYLHCVTVDDISVVSMMEEAVQIFETNIIGPVKYLKVYDEYLYILNGAAGKALDDFFAMEPFPYLKDFAKRIDSYQNIKRNIIFLRRSIPLNFICLECGDLNDTLYDIVEDLRMRICNYFIEQNHKHNRR